MFKENKIWKTAKIKIYQDNKICFDSIIKNLTRDNKSVDNKTKSGPNNNFKSSNKTRWNKFLNFNNNLINYKRRTSLPTISAKYEKEQIELNALIALIYS